MGNEATHKGAGKTEQENYHSTRLLLFLSVFTEPSPEGGPAARPVPTQVAGGEPGAAAAGAGGARGPRALRNAGHAASLRLHCLYRFQQSATRNPQKESAAGFATRRTPAGTR